MSLKFPELPKYFFTWRSIRIEPIPNSGERLTVGALLKGADGAFIAAKIVPASKLKAVFGKQIGLRLAGAVDVCLKSAEMYYQSKPLSSIWSPPLEGLYVSEETESLASNIDEGFISVASLASSLYLGVELEKSNVVMDGMKANNWRAEITKLIKTSNREFSECFDREVLVSGHGVPLKIGFYSEKYVAHFGSINSNSKHGEILMRAQSKLWQLDRLRDSDQILFSPDKYELVYHRPEFASSDGDWLNDFFEEIGYEASKRDLGLHTSKTTQEAANHVISLAS